MKNKNKRCSGDLLPTSLLQGMGEWLIYAGSFNDLFDGVK